MERFTKLILITLAIASLAGCKKKVDGDFDRSANAGGPFNGADSVIVGNISVNKTLSPGKVYKLSGIIYVINGAKLTIKRGTVITSGPAVNYKLSATGISIPMSGTLVITKGSSIDAVGTPGIPIIFTTPKGFGSRAPGDFGGIVVLGKSITNKSASQWFEGLPLYDANGNSLGIDISYGGKDSLDNSGRIEYVRIDYPGNLLAPGMGTSGLSLAGVGSGTVIDHIQVSYSGNDGFSFYGGTVNANYLLAIGCKDDDFDFSLGYTGSIRYAIGLKDPSSEHSLTSAGANDSNGIESDNDEQGSNDFPRTKPVCSNFILLGYANQGTTLNTGSHWRRNSNLSIQNSIIAGYDIGADFISGTQNTATIGGFTNNTIHGYRNAFSFDALSSGSLPRSLIGSTNTISTAVNPDLSVGLGLSGDNTTNLNPFYSTANSTTYSFDNLFPRDISTTKGAVTDANYIQWNSGWVSFIPQRRQD